MGQQILQPQSQQLLQQQQSFATSASKIKLMHEPQKNKNSDLSVCGRKSSSFLLHNSTSEGSYVMVECGTLQKSKSFLSSVDSNRAHHLKEDTQTNPKKFFFDLNTVTANLGVDKWNGYLGGGRAILRKDAESRNVVFSTML